MRDFNEEFNQDWNLSQELYEEVKNYFSEDISIEEARNRLLTSDLYQLWKSKNRVFLIEIESEEALIDLKSAYKFEEHCTAVDHLIQMYFDSKDLVRIESNNQLDLYISNVHKIYIPIDKLSYLVAEYSKKIDLYKPLKYKHLLEMLGGVTMVDINEDQLEKIANNSLLLDKLIDDIESYRK